MARTPDHRAPALPSSAGQKARYRRILRAAAEHGALHGLDHMQMTDVAKDAGVAIATLYRYFPSKTALFTELMRSQVDELSRLSAEVQAGQDPADAIARVLIRASRELLRRPRLAHAMIQSNNAALTSDTPAFALTDSFTDLILRIGGVERATVHDLRLARLVQQAWYGILISQLNQHIDPEDADRDTVLACRLILADLGAVAHGAALPEPV